MSRRLKKCIAVVIMLVLVGTTAWYWWVTTKDYETGTATLDNLLNSKSERKIGNKTAIASNKDPYLALIGTPIALYYENPPEVTKKASPLLVVCKKKTSRAVIRFLGQYGESQVTTLGDIPTTLSSKEREWEEPTTVNLDLESSFTGSTKHISLQVAEHFWKHSDGVVLVKKNQGGYNQAVAVMPFASYLNVPVIVTNEIDDTVAGVLGDLGVKYSLVCGKMKGYKLTKHFTSIEEIQDWTLSVVEKRLGGEVNYITMTNPLDIYELEVERTFVAVNESGEINHYSSTPYPGRPELGPGPFSSFEMPYKYANVKIDLWLDISHENYGDEAGARIYAFLGKDLNNNDQLDEEDTEVQFFAGSPAYEDVGYDGNPNAGRGDEAAPLLDRRPKSSSTHLYTETPVFNDAGEHGIQLLAKIPTDSDRPPPPLGGEWKAEYSLKVTVEKLSSYIYPRLESASSLAGYLTAYRKGVVLAKPSYMIYNDTYVKIHNSADPATNKNLTEPTNQRVSDVKADLNDLLGRMADMPTSTNEDVSALAKYYHSLNQNGSFTYLGILGDPTMVPHYYYPSKGLGEGPLEGYLVPSDNIYSDIDADLENPPFGLNESYPRLEIAEGRITGFNTQDVSALLCRSFFYTQIIEEMKGPENDEVNDMVPLGEYWKDSTFSCIGTEPPVGSAESGAVKFTAMMENSSFTAYNAPFMPGGGAGLPPPKRTTCSARQYGAPCYESANFIFICAHGFWYWYVPPAIKSFTPYFEIGAGGAFDVRHVKTMNMGPSVMWADSCVTGRIDGIPPYNALSHAFLHAGMNAYMGGTRSMWGVLVPTPDAYSGEKLGTLMMLHVYGHLTGHLYNKSADVQSFTPANTTTGVALMLAKNEYITQEGTDGGGENDDTYEEMLLHGDPAFNPYEPNHEGAGG